MEFCRKSVWLVGLSGGDKRRKIVGCTDAATFTDEDRTADAPKAMDDRTRSCGGNGVGFEAENFDGYRASPDQSRNYGERSMFQVLAALAQVPA
jgi:hypothetical protein